MSPSFSDLSSSLGSDVRRHLVVAVISVCEDVSAKKERIDRTNIVCPHHRSNLINATTYSISLGFDFYPQKEFLDSALDDLWSSIWTCRGIVPPCTQSMMEWNSTSGGDGRFDGLDYGWKANRKHRIIHPIPKRTRSRRAKPCWQRQIEVFPTSFYSSCGATTLWSMLPAGWCSCFCTRGSNNLSVLPELAPSRRQKCFVTSWSALAASWIESHINVHTSAWNLLSPQLLPSLLRTASLCSAEICCVILFVV